jgi:allantoin racemase
MRLLIVNSNTSERVTGIVANTAKRVASPGTELEFATGTFGASVIASRTENAIAAHATADLIARHAHSCDGVVIAVSYDSGLRAARELLGVPVVGITEASLLAALTLGTRIGLIVWGKGAVSVYLELVDSYGLGSRISGTRRIDLPATGENCDEAVLDEAIISASRDLVDRTDAEVIVLVGAVLSGRSSKVEAQLEVPVLDGMRCAVPMLEALVRIKARPASSGSYALPGRRETAGLSAELTQRLLAVP